jgi:hypothetical protein
MEAVLGKKLHNLGDSAQGRPSGNGAGYLAAAMEVIDELGGFDAYVERRLGLSPRARAQMRAQLVE